MASIKPADVHDSSVRGVSALLAAMSRSEGVSNEQAICDELEEFFRKRFRKVSADEAKSVILSLGPKNEEDKTSTIKALDEKFWFWETLEEATRPEVA